MEAARSCTFSLAGTHNLSYPVCCSTHQAPLLIQAKETLQFAAASTSFLFNSSNIPSSLSSFTSELATGSPAGLAKVREYLRAIALAWRLGRWHYRQHRREMYSTKALEDTAARQWLPSKDHTVVAADSHCYFINCI